MKQKETESITHFLARLQTLAKFCEFTVAYPNKPDCGWRDDNSNDMVAVQMVAGFTNMDPQTKILVGATTLVMQQQKYSTPHFNSTMYHTMVVNMQRSDCKKQSREVKISPTPQYVQPCRGCRRYSHLNRSMNCKDYPAAKMACFNCGIFGHMEKVCQKPKGGSANRSALSAANEESHIFITRGCMKLPRRRNDQSKIVNQRGKANAARPKAIPHLI